MMPEDVEEMSDDDVELLPVPLEDEDGELEILSVLVMEDPTVEDDGPYVKLVVPELLLAEAELVRKVVPLASLDAPVLVCVLSVIVMIVVRVELKVVVALPEEVVPP